MYKNLLNEYIAQHGFQVFTGAVQPLLPSQVKALQDFAKYLDDKNSTPDTLVINQSAQVVEKGATVIGASFGKLG